MAVFVIPAYKESPFLRITIPFIAGITAARFAALPLNFYIVSLVASMIVIGAEYFLPAWVKYRFRRYTGIALGVVIALCGAALYRIHDTSNVVAAVESQIASGAAFAVRLLEEPVEKPKTWKALAETMGTLSTRFVIYFRKDSMLPPPRQAHIIVFRRAPQRIENIASAPGFDYRQYCALRNIYFQVFLRANEYVVAERGSVGAPDRILGYLRLNVVSIIRKNINGRREQGLAEALLIGYKQDLDRQLMDAYVKTGVVHVIAISGLHLGMIYALLEFLCRPLLRLPRGKVASGLFIIGCLWVFSLLAGASASVIRSAVMFSFLVAGRMFSRRTSALNSLAASAFVLLAYDPRWLWDLGFQLSYFALLSILIFQRPLRSLLCAGNPVIDRFCSLNAVTLAAQILTTPVCIYYFRQFPNLFLPCNLVAVPLSSLILFGEILLCVLSPVDSAAAFCGNVLTSLIRLMNNIIEWFAGVSYSSTSNVSISFPQLLLWYCAIAALSAWLIGKEKKYLYPAIWSAILFVSCELFQ